MRICLAPGGPSLFLPILLLLAPGCSGSPEVPRETSFPPEGSMVVLKAKNYSFTPVFLHARAGEDLLLEVENLSRSDHNLTVEGPEGRTIRSVDLPAREKIVVKIRLKRRGKYPFYCDQPLHATMGMKGAIAAE